MNSLYMIIFVIIALFVAGVVFAVVMAVRYFTNKNNNDNMEKTNAKFTDSLTFKGIVIVILILLLLIPGAMIQGLISERQQRSEETVTKISDKWSLAQTVCAPVLVIPYTTTLSVKNSKGQTEQSFDEHNLYVTPAKLEIDAHLQPEQRHYGIYNAILYKSTIAMQGQFAQLKNLEIANSALHFDRAYILIGVTDLRGITQNIDFKLNTNNLTAAAGTKNSLFDGNITDAYPLDKVKERMVFIDDYEKKISGKSLIINTKGITASDSLDFICNLQLNGSSEINFIPVGQTTQVTISGKWQSPSFVGAFTPDYSLDNSQFTANWSILNFNRSIPAIWSDNEVASLRENAFGVNLLEPVDHYQQNMRSAKYALMFIALTFVVFFFVEIFTEKRIHPIQYLLVGIALILFYSLLLSFSEQIGFALAYVVASAATITLITLYAHSIFKNLTPTLILAGILTILYVFLFVILQLEDIALLIGSVGLFLILGIIMFVSRKINRYKGKTA
ncbi:MAG: cell envelope integrity protein CreD [Prevotellaceae bacterium]|jgi:inner membrane protein|nr:cell envelope integrity protein CreD [Prevotellaceae bacterium]